MRATPSHRLNKERLFARLGYVPHEGQLAVHSSKAKRRILACGSRWGKSVAAAMEAVAAAMEPRTRAMIWVVAPSLDLADKVYREVGMVVAEHLRHRIIEMKQHDKRLVLRNLGGGVSEIRAKTADNPLSLLGEGLDFVIVDEAARLKPLIWNSYLAQRLVDKDGTALLISTPKGKGWFYDMWRRGQGGDPHYESWNAPSWQNPHIKRELIEAERGRIPERVFRQEFAGEFIEGAGQVFRNVRESATGGWRGPKSGQFYYVGLDLARVEDFTVLVVMDESKRVVWLDRFTKLDWSLQIGRIKAATDHYNGAEILVDSTGAGEPVFESMREADLSVMPYPFTAASKAALVNNLALMLEQRELILPRVDLCPELVDELEAFEYSVTDAGSVRTGAPYGIHDDCVMALALAAWQVKKESQVYWSDDYQET